MAIKERIKERRSVVGLTLEDVAKSINVGRATVQRWESGTISTIRDDKILLLAKVLQTSPEYLLGAVNNPEPREAFHSVILQDQWMRENYPSDFDREKFHAYQQPILDQVDLIVNYVYSLCMQVPIENVQAPEGLDLKPHPEDPCYDEKMGVLIEYMQTQQGVVNVKRLEGILELFKQMEEIIKLKIKLSDEISLAES